jgi:acyl-CoA thioesterase I
MTVGIRITVLCVLALCAGCRRQPRIERLSASSVVVAFGDSLTSGTGASDSESYPAVLAGLLGCRVVNAGVPGEDTAAGLRRFPAVLESVRPQLVLLCHGGNDMLRKQDQQGTIANLNAMISLAKGTGADVILIGVPKPGLLLREAPFYEEIAAKYHIPLEPGTLSQILSSPALKSDYAHPNEAGYKKLAGSIAKLIRGSEREDGTTPKRANPPATGQRP